MEYTCTKFGVDSSSRFSLRARTDRQTEKQTDPTERALPKPAAMPAWVINQSQKVDKLTQQVMSKSGNKYGYQKPVYVISTPI